MKNVQAVSNTLESQAISYRQLDFSVEQKNKASVSLKTQEGDVVQLSFNIVNKYAESSSTNNTADGSTGDFSAVAMAASQYSMSVQGDLNEEEMAAIKKMADAITPIAQDFFSQNNAISLEQTSQSLSASMGTLQEVVMELEMSVTEAVTETTVSRPKAENLPQQQASVAPEMQYESQTAGIRAPEALTNAVVESVFHKEGSKIDDPVVLRGLSDLMDYLKQRLQDFLAQHKSALSQQPEATEASKPQPENKIADNATAPATDKALIN